jgi:thiol-disulfide isomerase/thioredoxin
MSSSNKVLLLITLLLSAVSGWLIYGKTNSPTLPDSAAVLNAELLDANGNAIKVIDNLSKINVVNYWASWCAPCREEMPLLENTYQRFSKDGFNVIGIAIDSVEKAQPFLDSMAISYPIMYAERTGMRIMAATGNENGFLPYTLILDQSGKVIERKIGLIHDEDVAKWVAKIHD